MATDRFEGLAPVFALHDEKQGIEDTFTDAPEPTML